MSDQIFVKPGVVDGAPAVVRHKARNGGRDPVPAEGCFLPNDTHTRRRINEGGLVRCDAATEEPKPALAVRRAKPGDRPADGTGE